MAIRRAAKPAPAKKRRAPGTKRKAPPPARTFWDDLADIGRSIPPEELALLPSAEHFDEEFDHASGR